MILIVVALTILSMVLFLAALGLHVNLQEAKKDAAAWKAIALAIDDTYVRVPTISRIPTGREMRH
jgi:hypothetical protein